MPADDRFDEFGLIRHFLRPLAGEGAGNLEDDVARLPGTGLIATKDLLIAGVHFLPDDPPDLIARKALRVNVSDIVCKGAKPVGYFLGLALHKACDTKWLEAFASGLQNDQEEYGLSLLGGDTTRHSGNGPLMISVTMLGEPVARKGPVDRSGASAGDIVAVTGTIGDAGLGLQIATGSLSLGGEADPLLLSAYRLPAPAALLAGAIAEGATASLDISDGLIADAGHLADASGLSITIDLDAMPVSPAAQKWLDTRPDEATARAALASAGDDYQILFTASPAALEEIRQAGEEGGVRVTPIGRCFAMDAKPRIEALFMKKPVHIKQTGFNHFSK